MQLPLQQAEIYKYTGETSPPIETCISGVNTSLTEGKIFANCNPNFSSSQSRKEILAEIGAILGHAVQNSEINWTWNTEKQQYTFSSHIEDTAFWKCYFHNETIFFRNFFIQASILTDSEFLSLKEKK